MWCDYGTSQALSGPAAMGTILLVVLILLLLGTFPRWNHSRNWGYGRGVAHRRSGFEDGHAGL